MVRMRALLRGVSSLLLLLLLLLLLSASSSSSYRLDKIVGTSEYELYVQADCAHRVDSPDGSPRCPIRGLHRLDLPGNCPRGVHAHLLHDPAGLHPPRILEVFQNPLMPGPATPPPIRFRFSELHSSSSSSTSAESADPDGFSPVAGGWLLSLGDRFAKVDHLVMSSYEKLENSIFDSSSMMLYIITRTNVGSSVRIFYVRNPFAPVLTEPLIKRFGELDIYLKNLRRYAWMEDPYERKVYYLEKGKDHQLLFSLPIEQITSAFLDGFAGEFVAKFSHDYTDFSVMNGIVFAVNRTTSNSTAMGIQRLSDRNAFQCKAPASSHEIHSFNVIMIIGKELCLLRSGGGKENVEKCQEADIRRAGGYGIDFCPAVPWMIIGMFLMVVVICLLIAYAVLLRRNLDEMASCAEQEAIPYYPAQGTTGGGAGIESTFDVSVDNWQH